MWQGGVMGVGFVARWMICSWAVSLEGCFFGEGLGEVGGFVGRCELRASEMVCCGSVDMVSSGFGLETAV